MSFEPSWAVNVVLITGLAGFYLWWLISESHILAKPLAYPREHWGLLWNCPFCAGFYLTALLLIVSGTYDPITHLAATGICGFAGKAAA